MLCHNVQVTGAATRVQIQGNVEFAGPRGTCTFLLLWVNVRRTPAHMIPSGALGLFATQLQDCWIDGGRHGSGLQARKYTAAGCLPAFGPVSGDGLGILS